MMLSNCEEATLDSQQRINLTGNLLKEATLILILRCKVLILGVMDHIEFWHPEEFSAYQNSFTETFEEIATKVLSKKVNN
jgi:DNA-binding transcriptional regulator/RsmH inhibitor MraZ